MSAPSVLRSVARQCVAAAALFGFSLNVATPTIAHGCAHPATAGMMAESSGTHHPHGSPGPAEQPTHGKKCECVGHTCGAALAVVTPAACGPRVMPVFARAPSVHSVDRLPAIVQHLLPFAVGPPSSLA